MRPVSVLTHSLTGLPQVNNLHSNAGWTAPDGIGCAELAV
jgi:hypothetical protein